MTYDSCTYTNQHCRWQKSNRFDTFKFYFQPTFLNIQVVMNRIEINTNTLALLILVNIQHTWPDRIAFVFIAPYIFPHVPLQDNSNNHKDILEL